MTEGVLGRQGAGPLEGGLPILYSFRRCPYAMRARLAIAASGTRCELREIVLRDKPVAMLMASPKGTVPVLVDTDGTVIDQSLDIMLWALRQRDPQGWLSPQHRVAMLALIEECDTQFKFHLDRYKYPQRYENTQPEPHRDAGMAWLQGLEVRLEQMPYLFGPEPMLADMAIAPFVRQFVQTNADWFERQPLPQTKRWLKVFLESALFASVMHKYPVWLTGEPGVVFPG